MVKGLDKFREYFADFSEQYVLIGGAACDISFNEVGADFRATKDLDVVLVVEALTKEFGQLFWEFVREGGYQHRARSNGSPQFYRFEKPENKEFPKMIELFARTDTVLHPTHNAAHPRRCGRLPRPFRPGPGTPAPACQSVPPSDPL